MERRQRAGRACPFSLRPLPGSAWRQAGTGERGLPRGCGNCAPPLTWLVALSTQRCLHLDHGQVLKGSVLQPSLVKRPEETGEGTRVSAEEVRTTDDVETRRPLSSKTGKLGDAFHKAPRPAPLLRGAAHRPQTSPWLFSPARQAACVTCPFSIPAARGTRPARAPGTC